MLVAATHEDVDNVAWRVRRVREHVQDDRFIVALCEFLFAPRGRVLVCSGDCAYSVVSAHTLVRGCPICAYCITVVGGVAIWCAICFLVLDVAPHCARSVLLWGAPCL